MSDDAETELAVRTVPLKLIMREMQGRLIALRAFGLEFQDSYCSTTNQVKRDKLVYQYTDYVTHDLWLVCLTFYSLNH